jgi:hypothetical protein
MLLRVFDQLRQVFDADAGGRLPLITSSEPGAMARTFSSRGGAHPS